MKGRLIKWKDGLRGRINLSFLLIVAIAVVSFMIISINRSSEVLKDTSVDHTLQLIQMMNENIESYVENMENIAEIVTSNSDVRNYLKYDRQEADYLSNVEEQFATLKETRKDIYNIGVLGKNGTYLINNRNVKVNPYVEWETLTWYSKAMEGVEKVSSSHVQNIVDEDYPWVVTVSKVITDPVDGEILGVFFVDLNYRSISNLAEELNLRQKGYVFIVDEDGGIVYHPKQQLIYSGLWEEELTPIMDRDINVSYWETEDKLYTITRSELTGWTVVGVTDLNEMLSSTDDLIQLYYILAVALIGIAMLLAVMLTDKITLPLRQLQKSMQTVQAGNFTVDIVESNTQDEIGDLIRTFRIMIQEIEHLIKRNNDEQEEKRKSELNALQAQINPHFLYNTLDSIIWMAEDGNTKDVVLMTSSLAKLFRKSISNNNKLVSVVEELEYTKSYLTIQNMRYKGKLKYSINVEAAIADMQIIKLIVQPLVENAIYHGIKYKKGIGTILIEAKHDTKGIVIKVIDDGYGMTEDQLTHIFDKREIDEQRNGVGVRNVQRRIQLFYGDEYGLEFVSKLGHGTIVSIYLPMQIGGNDDILE